MFDKEDLVATILDQADAVLIVQQVQEILQSEQQKRRAFYDLIDEDTKAEFVNGEILYHSPVAKKHNDATGLLYTLMRTFNSMLRLGYVGIEKILTKFTRNDYEPDICFFGQEKAQDFQPGQLIFPIPDLAVEVLSKSSQKAIDHDRVIKYADYEKHGVREYWIVDADDETVEQYILEAGKYRLVLKSSEGMIRSHSIPGFVIPIRAIFDEATNLTALKAMLGGT